MTHHVELLPNGLIRVFDRRAAWAALYRRDGSYHSGAPDCPAYRRAAGRFFA